MKNLVEHSGHHLKASGEMPDFFFGIPSSAFSKVLDCGVHSVHYLGISRLLTFGVARNAWIQRSMEGGEFALPPCPKFHPNPAPHVVACFLRQR